MNTNIQDHYQTEQTDQIPPIRDLIKLTGVAAFFYLFFAGVHIFLSGQGGGFFSVPGVGSGWVFIIFVILILILFLFCQFLPWMESYGLNRLSRAADWGWTLFVAFVSYILMFAVNYVLMYIPFFNPVYWVASAERSGSMAGAGLIGVVYPLLFLAVAYGVWWCSFSLMTKLRGSVANLYPSEDERRRASQVTKWSFVLFYSAGTALVVAIYTLALIVFIGMYSRNPIAPGMLFLIFFGGYVITLLVMAVLIYAFTDNCLPKNMQRVRPDKLFLSYALIFIILSLVGFAFNALSDLFKYLMPANDAVRWLLLAIFLVAVGWMCKKLLVDTIRIMWMRIFVVVLIFLMSLGVAISKARHVWDFFLILLLVSSITVFILFFISQAIKWGLRIVYGAPQDFEE